jgi:integrase/recombinase XerD
MASEQTRVSHPFNRFSGGPLDEFLDGFCDSLLQAGFASNTIYRHLLNISHLNQYLSAKKNVNKQTLSAVTVREFFRDYPAQARNRGSMDHHIASVKYSINRLTKYLRASGCFKTLEVSMVDPPMLITYCEWLDEYQCAAPGTIKLRSHSIRQFLHWLASHTPPLDCSKLTPDMVERFVLLYAKHKGHAARRSMQAALRTFFRFCLQQGYIQQPLDRAVPTLRCYKLSTVTRGLSEEQSLKLLQRIDRTTSAGVRGYAICQLLYTYGVRRGQVSALRLKDIDWAGDRIVFRALKGGKDVLLPLTREVGTSLLDYLQNARPDSQDPHFFLTLRAPYHGLDSSSALSNLVNRYIQDTGIDIASKGAHAFRHGFATRMLAQGNSLKAIADVLGHRHLESTFIYTKVDFNHLQQVALPWPGEVSL